MQELNLNKQKLDSGVNYFYVYQPSHPLANLSGKVYVHRYMISIQIGRWVTSEEVVHHKDGNRHNNSADNLEIMTRTDHASHHHKPCDRHEGVCSQCGAVVLFDSKRLTRSVSGNMFCSSACCRLFSRKFNVSAEELERLVWEFPTTHIAKMFGVSGKAVEKRCKTFGILKPPRGYWAKEAVQKI